MKLSEKRFLKIIRYNHEQLATLKANINTYYTEQLQEKKDQFGNTIYLESGEPKQRVINPSHGELKRIQNIIKRRILRQLSYPEFLHGSIRGKSCITNARFHQGNKYFLQTDLKDFFPSIHFKYVYDSLVRMGFIPTVASHLTRLMTYNKCVPQGAPTSSYVANLAFLPYDEQIKMICDKYGMKYTRYCDDLAFSSKQPITKKIADELLGVIRSSPFQYHHRKTYMETGVTEITGIQVYNNHLDAPPSKYEKLNSLEPDSNSAKGLNQFIESIKEA